MIFIAIIHSIWIFWQENKAARHESEKKEKP